MQSSRKPPRSLSAPASNSGVWQPNVRPPLLLTN
jgi:hypothetical protein